jgi:hypothetical protein
MPGRDFSTSRAVLVGTWDYQHLPPVPAARNSLDRMRALLTGELCGWPEDRVTVIGNRASPGNLHNELIQLYRDTEPDGIALFFYVGHGQPDDEDQLCLGLVGSDTDHDLRASTSLRFEDVRDALRKCAARTKIVMLDCCFAGLAARPRHSLSGADVLDMVRGAGAYTMAASGAYLPAWFETDAESPQTYFTRYFVDVVESGIAGEPASLTLDRIFAETHGRLGRDSKPEPTHTARHEAGRTIFARNAAPAEKQVDQQARIAELEELLRIREAALDALHAEAAGTDEIVETGEAEARRAEAAEELTAMQAAYEAEEAEKAGDQTSMWTFEDARKRWRQVDEDETPPLGLPAIGPEELAGSHPIENMGNRRTIVAFIIAIAVLGCAHAYVWGGTGGQLIARSIGASSSLNPLARVSLSVLAAIVCVGLATLVASAASYRLANRLVKVPVSENRNLAAMVLFIGGGALGAVGGLFLGLYHVAGPWDIQVRVWMVVLVTITIVTWIVVSGIRGSKHPEPRKPNQPSKTFQPRHTR